MDKSDITSIRSVAAGGCTKRLAALADDFSRIVRLPLTTIACGGTLTANPSYSHTMCPSSARRPAQLLPPDHRRRSCRLIQPLEDLQGDPLPGGVRQPDHLLFPQ